jgi:quinolinate synthase
MNFSKEELIKEIKKLKEKNNAIIVAHLYQEDDIQEIADITGDSLALAKHCVGTDKEIIVFAGVHFMAESAKILSPEKTVLLPEIDAGCPMADMVEPEGFIDLKKKHPDATVVCYINSSAAVKAECDICCTSSNAIEVVKKIKSKKIIFVPDQNLGQYVAKMLPEKEIILWEGYCITHHRIKVSELEAARKAHPDAKVLVHPECQPEILENSDFTGSTKQILDFAKNSSKKEFIIGTEMGVLYRLKKENPDKTFYLMSPKLICNNMKKNTLESIYYSLKYKRYNIEVDEETRKKAKKALDRMLEI